jgi:hypothetical protein
MRKKLEAEEEARRNAEKRLQEMERYYAQKPQQHNAGNNDSSDDDIGADPDDFLQVKHYKKTATKWSTKLAEQEKRIEQLTHQLQRVEAETSLKDIKDFDNVVNDDTMKNLARLYPDDYEVMMANSDLKKKSKTAYNMIKKYGIYNDGLVESDKKVEKNKSKPVNPGVGGQTAATPLSRLNDYDRRVLTEADRTRILARLDEVKRNGGSGSY